jgi:nucleoside-diphosphate-sugar epimerase
VYSWIQIDDAARPTVGALERAKPGVYDVVDDDPASVREWLPVYASAIGAKPPFRIPLWLARLVAGRGFVEWERVMPGASNRKIKQEIGWQPVFASWRQGFFEGLG